MIRAPLYTRMLKLAAVCVLVCGSAVRSSAATTTATFTAQIIIQASCQILSPGNLDFGTAGALVTDVDATATFQVQCTNTTPYNVGLDAGTTGGGTVATRKMTSGAATVDYRMYSDPSRTTNWGNTVGVDTVSDTGTGAAQTFTVYGRVPTQSTPAPATYTDTVTITVTY